VNFIDILIFIPLIYAGYRGFKKGFIIEIFTLLAFFVGIYAAVNFSDYASIELSNRFDIESSYLPPLAFTLTFLIVGALVFFAGKAIEGVVKAVALSPFNKVAGLLFGLIKMVYILSVILMLVESYDEKGKWMKTETKTESLFYEPVKAIGKNTLPGMKESQIFIENAFKSESDSTGLTVREVLRAKEIADSLGIDAKEAKKLYEVHQKYN
jgi:membrane protein required for colicin V production